jgi:O-antigen ligase
MLFGVLVLIYRIIFFKQFINNKFAWVLIAFAVSNALSILLNDKSSYIEGFQGFIWLVFQISILYIFDSQKTFEYYYSEFKKLLVIFLSFTVIANIISIWMYYSGVSVPPISGNYGQGYVWGRLWGVYVDPNNGAILSSAGILICIFFSLIFKRKWVLLLLAFSALIEIVYISLSGSRTGIVCTSIGIAVIVGVLTHRNKLLASRNVYFKFCTAIFTSVIAVSFMYMAISNVGNLFPIEKNVLELDKEILGPDEEISIGKTEREKNLSEDISNRRFDIWKSGVQIFQSRPVFGVSFRNIVNYAENKLPSTYIVSNDYIVFNSMHNMIVDVLVSQGLIGITILSIFITSIAIYIFRRLRHLDEQMFKLAVVIFSVLICLSTASLFISDILYVNSPSSFLFWICLGFLIYFLQKKSKVTK